MADQSTVTARRPSRPVVPGLAANLFNEMNAFDADAALRRLDHVIDRESCDRHGCESFHLYARWPGHFDRRTDDAAR